MTVHMIKLCVGAQTPEDLKVWQDYVQERTKAETGVAELYHRTRMFPKRADEMSDGGSLYWVIKGIILVRQEILGLRQVVDDEGIKRCDVILKPKLTPVRPTPRRPFQGWRYLPVEDAPKDLAGGDSELEHMSTEMRSQLAELGLI